jgi:NAD(P)-dependent dehydrogenase (short-subunit alcohol dehydrogenase family)
MKLPRRLMTVLLALAVSVTSQLSLAAESRGTVLITGANRGIGLGLAEQFTAGGYTVIGTARKPAQATQLKALGARVEQLDVASVASVSALAGRLENETVDILINNAGITGHDEKDFAALDIEQLDHTMNVNLYGPLRVTQALLPNVEKSKARMVVNMSSMMGSMELNTWGCCVGYRASKAALNSVNRSLSLDLAKRGFTFVVMHPGYVKTDMNQGKGNYSAQESSAGLYKVISGLDKTDNGKFYDFQGKELPW